ncbi:hypothetical protein JTB14_028301 [Gonioctena quinquepunctata]|nr:hypothetical protein JTB14_028301 [Gonioctena quinquepunctata]
MVHPILIRGTHKQQARFYEPSRGNTFLCIHSSEVINFKKVNDDYCDCMDGSDEPGTNACPNGIFYCFNQTRIPKSIGSHKVNDGICDCCDGSDEWKNDRKLKYFNDKTVKKLYRHHPPCPNTC